MGVESATLILFSMDAEGVVIALPWGLGEDSLSFSLGDTTCSVEIDGDKWIGGVT